jgi:hypothetical protein
MAKQKKGKHVSTPPASKRLYQGLLAVAVIGAMVAVYFFAGRDTASVSSPATTAASDPLAAAATSTNPALRNRLILPAIPQRPRPITLEPTAFSDPETRAAYQAAKDSPEALETVACYCGCYSEAAHRNNLDCYKDNHGVT